MIHDDSRYSRHFKTSRRIPGTLLDVQAVKRRLWQRCLRAPGWFCCCCCGKPLSRLSSSCNWSVVKPIARVPATLHTSSQEMPCDSLLALSDSCFTLFLKLLCLVLFDVKKEYREHLRTVIIVLILHFLPKTVCPVSIDIPVLSLRLALIFVLDGEVTGLRSWTE